jgi:hypothetical protein
MTGYDFNPHFEKMWQYVNGTLAEEEYEKAIAYSKIGFATRTVLQKIAMLQLC